jgi:peroxiredoxin
MRPILDRYSIDIYALSKDTVALAQRHVQRDHLSFTLLADPERKVIKSYGRLHQKGFEFFTFYLFGIPVGFPTGFDQMALPTTVLIDEEGTVRWLDMASDYRLRGDAAQIESALQSVFGPPP